MEMRKNAKTYLFAVALFMVAVCLQPLTVQSQISTPPTDDSGSDFSNPDAEVPIDGGLALLLAAGAGYGVKKYRQNRQQSLQEKNNETSC